MGGAMLNKSSIQFSVDGWACVPSLLFTWGQTVLEVVKILATSFKGPMDVLLHSVPLTVQQDTTDPCVHQRLLDTPMSVSYGITAPFTWVLVHRRFCLCPARVYFPVLCKFWQLNGGVNGNFL